MPARTVSGIRSRATAVICQQKMSAMVRPIIKVEATSTKLEMVCEASVLVLSELTLTRCTSAGLVLLYIYTISILMVVLNAAFLRRTDKFYPIYRKLHSLMIIMNRLSSENTKRKIDRMWLLVARRSF